MTGTELARRADQAAATYQQPTAQSGRGWQATLEQAELLSHAGDMIPAKYRGRVGAIIAVALAGEPFGWNPMTSMRMFYAIQGAPRLTAEAQAALIRQAGHRLDVELVGESATATLQRKDGSKPVVAVWDRARAERAQLWSKWSEAGTTEYMLRWRAISEVARFGASDLMFGMAADDDWATDPPTTEPAQQVAPVAPAAPAAEIITPVLEDGRIVEKHVKSLRLETTPPDPLPYQPRWAAWGPNDWIEHCKGSLGLPEIRSRLKLPRIRTWADVAGAADEVRFAIYHAAIEAADPDPES